MWSLSCPFQQVSRTIPETEYNRKNEFMMKTVVIASQNPVKITAVRNAFQRMFPKTSFTFEGIAVPSGVADQPMSRAETSLGATQRAAAAQQSLPHAAFWVGIEGGVEEIEEQLAAFAWMVLAPDHLAVDEEHARALAVVAEGHVPPHAGRGVDRA